jgi:hypothetical protein
MLNEPDSQMNRDGQPKGAHAVQPQGSVRGADHSFSSSGRIPRVLLLAGDLFSVHKLRVLVRHAGLSLVFDCVTNGEDFLHRLQAAEPDIAVCCLHRLQTTLTRRRSRPCLSS